jgi:hypothetical protein
MAKLPIGHLSGGSYPPLLICTFPPINPDAGDARMRRNPIIGRGKRAARMQKTEIGQGNVSRKKKRKQNVINGNPG